MTPQEIIAAVLLASGCFFALTGSVGVLRMPDFYTRLHPAGKSDTLAQALILGGLMVLSGDPLTIGKLALLALLLLVTAPTSTHAITKAARLDPRMPDPLSYSSGPATGSTLIVPAAVVKQALEDMEDEAEAKAAEERGDADDD